MPGRIATPAAASRGPSPALSLLAAGVLAASCATQPMGDNKGKPIFQSFNQCMVANGVGALLLGALAKNLTGSTTVGVAAAAATLFAAWKACGAAHQRVTVSDERGRDATLAADSRYRNPAQPVLSLDSLEVVAPKAGEDITTRYRFGYTSPDAGKKDIAAKERFIYLAGFTNDKGQQEFKEIEFERDFVMQQGQRRHEHAVPSDQSFNQFKPWKLRYQLEVDGRCVEAEAPFAIDSPTPGRAGPARACTPRGAGGTAAAAVAAQPVASTAPAAAPAPSVAPAAVRPEPVIEGTLLRALRLQQQPGGAFGGKTLPQGTRLRILETKEIKSGNRTVNWVRVQSAAGDSGWTLDTNLRR